jgi:hypothetical protein
MPDYLETPPIRKVALKVGQRPFVSSAPPTIFGDLEPSVNGTIASTNTDNQFGMAFLFVRHSGELHATFGLCADYLPLKGAIRVAWPNKAARNSSDVTFDLVQEPGFSTGLVDNKVCAIDVTWAALRCVTRVRARQAAQAQAP